jgi:hypothetical protein
MVDRPYHEEMDRAMAMEARDAAAMADYYDEARAEAEYERWRDEQDFIADMLGDPPEPPPRRIGTCLSCGHSLWDDMGNIQGCVCEADPTEGFPLSCGDGSCGVCWECVTAWPVITPEEAEVLAS